MPYKNPNSEEAKAKRRELAARPKAKEAKKKYQKEYYQKNKDKYYDYNVKSRNPRKELLEKIKSVPCMDCGISYPTYIMDLDHRDPSTKKSNVSRLVRQGAWDDFIAEIEKCDVICANCHRERTYGKFRPQNP